MTPPNLSTWDCPRWTTDQIVRYAAFAEKLDLLIWVARSAECRPVGLTTKEGRMAKRQSRRTISVKGVNYRRFRRLCEARGVAMAAKIDQMITEVCDAAGVEDPGPMPMCKTNPGKAEIEEVARAHFTF